MSLYPNQITSVIVPAKVDSIRTQRLLLRPMAPADSAGIFAIRGLQEVANTLWPKFPDKDVEETIKWLEGKTYTTPDASGATGRQFYFVIIRRDDLSERIVGIVGINSLDPSPSVGYAVHPEFWNQGYATEAVGAVVDAWWKLPRASLDLGKQNSPGGIAKPDDDNDDVEKLFAACNMANVGSVQVLLKNGFEICTRIPIEGDIVALMVKRNPNSLS